LQKAVAKDVSQVESSVDTAAAKQLRKESRAKKPKERTSKKISQAKTTLQTVENVIVIEDNGKPATSSSGVPPRQRRPPKHLQDFETL
jgi:hypothetical protein